METISEPNCGGKATINSIIFAVCFDHPIAYRLFIHIQNRAKLCLVLHVHNKTSNGRGDKNEDIKCPPFLLLKRTPPRTEKAGEPAHCSLTRPKRRHYLSPGDMDVDFSLKGSQTEEARFDPQSFYEKLFALSAPR